MPRPETISASVVLRTASGEPLTDAIISAADVDAFTADPEEMEQAARFFAERGFEVSGRGLLSFAISADPERFRALFPDATLLEAIGPRQLELAPLPDEVRRLVIAVELRRPEIL